MNDLSYEIREFHETRHELENKLVHEVSRLVLKYGIVSDDKKKIILDLNPSEVSSALEISQTLVVVDWKTGDYNYQDFKTLWIEKAGDYLIRLYYETESWCDAFSVLSTDYMIELYEVLRDIENGRIKDITVNNGKLIVKE